MPILSMYVCTCVHVCAHVCMHACMYVCVCMCVRACTRVYACVCAPTHMHTYSKGPISNYSHILRSGSSYFII